jgi:hypothetical protein
MPVAALLNRAVLESFSCSVYFDRGKRTRKPSLRRLGDTAVVGDAARVEKEPRKREPSTVTVAAVRAPVAEDDDEDAVENLCPVDGCGKLLRTPHLLEMHIKHGHPEYAHLVNVSVIDVAKRTRAGPSTDGNVNDDNVNHEEAGQQQLGLVKQIAKMEASKKRKKVVERPQDVSIAAVPVTESPQTRKPKKSGVFGKKRRRKGRVGGPLPLGPNRGKKKKREHLQQELTEKSETVEDGAGGLVETVSDATGARGGGEEVAGVASEETGETGFSAAASVPLYVSVTATLTPKVHKTTTSTGKEPQTVGRMKLRTSSKKKGGKNRFVVPLQVVLTPLYVSSSAVPPPSLSFRGCVATARWSFIIFVRLTHG